MKAQIMIEPVVRLRIELQETNPKVWRQVDMPLSATLLALHEIIQALMGWDDVHLFEFTAGDRLYGEPYPDDPNGDRKIYKATSVRLRTLLDRGIHRFLYVYDFGDYWRLDVTVEEVRDGTSGIDYPAFVDGARRAPPEDVGGTAGFEDFLEAVTDPDHEDHKHMLEWYGGPYDPDNIDERHVRMIVEDFAARRRGPLKSNRTGKKPWH